MSSFPRLRHQSAFTILPLRLNLLLNNLFSFQFTNASSESDENSQTNQSAKIIVRYSPSTVIHASLSVRLYIHRLTLLGLCSIRPLETILSCPECLYQVQKSSYVSISVFLIFVIHKLVTFFHFLSFSLHLKTLRSRVCINAAH